jgi:hypothetical protein
MYDHDFSYDWFETGGEDLIICRRWASNGEFVEEQYLSGDAATQFRREYNAAKNQENSKAFKAKCDMGIMRPGELVQNTMSAYF